MAPRALRITVSLSAARCRRRIVRAVRKMEASAPQDRGLSHEGWLSIQLLSTFHRLRSITPDPNVIAEALQYSPELEVNAGRVRKRWENVWGRKR